MVMMGRGYLGLDIWPEAPNQGTNIKDKLLIT